MTTIPAHVAITEAAVGGKVLILLFVWLISGAAGSWLAERKGYGERLGLTLGLLLSALGLLIVRAAARAPRLEVAGRGVAAATAPPPDLSPWGPRRPARPGAWSASRRC